MLQWHLYLSKARHQALWVQKISIAPFRCREIFCYLQKSFFSWKVGQGIWFACYLKHLLDLSFNWHWITLEVCCNLDQSNNPRQCNNSFYNSFLLLCGFRSRHCCKEELGTCSSQCFAGCPMSRWRWYSFDGWWLGSKDSSGLPLQLA